MLQLQLWLQQYHSASKISLPKIHIILSSKVSKMAVMKVETEIIHWGKADDRNCNYGHPKMADVESGKNLFCRLNCFYNVF